MDETNETDAVENETRITFDDIYGKWLASMTTSIICSVLVIYIIISLSYFTAKTQICRKIKAGSLDMTKTSSALVLVFCFVLCFSTLFHFVSLLPLLGIAFGRTMQEPFCQFYHRFTTLMAGVSFGFACFALWFRVYAIFYRHPLIRSTMSKKVRFLSKSAVVYLVIMLVVNLATFLSAPPYKTEPIGCKRAMSSGHSSLKWSLLVASFVLFQATLFFLLVYPLVMHRRHTLHLGFQSAKVMPVIKRAFATALVCVLSNIITAFYGIVYDETFTYVRHIVYGLNFVVCLLALICFSADWKERLLPCFLDRQLLRNPSSRLLSISQQRSSNLVFNVCNNSTHSAKKQVVAGDSVESFVPV